MMSEQAAGACAAQVQSPTCRVGYGVLLDGESFRLVDSNGKCMPFPMSVPSGTELEFTLLPADGTSADLDIGYVSDGLARHLGTLDGTTVHTVVITSDTCFTPVKYSKPIAFEGCTLFIYDAGFNSTIVEVMQKDFREINSILDPQGGYWRSLAVYARVVADEGMRISANTADGVTEEINTVITEYCSLMDRLSPEVCPMPDKTVLMLLSGSFTAYGQQLGAVGNAVSGTVVKLTPAFKLPKQLYCSVDCGAFAWIEYHRSEFCYPIPVPNGARVVEVVADY